MSNEVKPPRGLIGVVREELSKFWKDPISYAIETWVSAMCLAIGIAILIAAGRMIMSSLGLLGS